MSKAAKKQKRELRDLVALRDSQIDLSDMPEVRDWSHAVVGKFYRPSAAMEGQSRRRRA